MYNIILKPKKTVDVTKEQFHGFNYHEVAVFFINHPIAIEFASLENEYRVWMNEGRLYQCTNYPRFTGLDVYAYRRAEIGYVAIPANHPLIKTLHKYFKRSFFKK